MVSVFTSGCSYHSQRRPIHVSSKEYFLEYEKVVRMPYWLVFVKHLLSARHGARVVILRPACKDCRHPYFSSGETELREVPQLSKSLLVSWSVNPCQSDPSVHCATPTPERSRLLTVWRTRRGRKALRTRAPSSWGVFVQEKSPRHSGSPAP